MRIPWEGGEAGFSKLGSTRIVCDTMSHRKTVLHGKISTVPLITLCSVNGFDVPLNWPIDGAKGCRKCLFRMIVLNECLNWFRTIHELEEELNPGLGLGTDNEGRLPGW